jgi:hypothetical protein
MNTTTLAIVALIAVAAMAIGFYAMVQEAAAQSFRQGGNQRSSCRAIVVSRAGCGNNEQRNEFRVD